MRSLPTWAVWLIVVPPVLLSPAIALLLAILSEAVICAIVDAGPRRAPRSLPSPAC